MITGVPHKSTGQGMNADGVVGKSKIGSPQRTGNHKEMDVHLLVCVCVRVRACVNVCVCVCTCCVCLHGGLGGGARFHAWKPFPSIPVAAQ